MTMSVGRRLLLATAATGLIIGAGIAAAQDRSSDDTMRSRSPKAAQTQSDKSKYNRTTDENADKTTGQSSSSDDQSRSNAAPDNSKASISGGSDADRDKGQRTDNRAGQKDSTVGEKTNGQNGQSAAESNNRRRPSTQRSDQTKPSSASQTTPSTDRQPSDAVTGQSREPAAVQSNTDRNAASSSQNAASPSRDQATNAGRAQSSTRVSASLQTADKTRLDRAVAKVDIKPVSSVNFSVSVGTAVPDTITLHPVPTDIVAVIPQYRGYDFFVVKDEFVIVEPQTHKIVDVIERSGSRAEATPTITKRKINLSQKDRSYIREHLTTRHTTTTGVAPPSEQRIIVGEDVPESVEIDSFPEDVYREVPAVRSYRYIHSGNDVYLVEPGSRRVIESIGDED